MVETEPPDYNPGTYLPKVNALIGDVNSALKNKRTKEYKILLNQLSNLEEGLPSVVNKTAVRTIASGRVRLQLGLIKELEASAA